MVWDKSSSICIFVTLGALWFWESSWTTELVIAQLAWRQLGQTGLKATVRIMGFALTQTRVQISSICDLEVSTPPLLSLIFFICKMEEVIFLLHRGVMSGKWDDLCRKLAQRWHSACTSELAAVVIVNNLKASQKNRSQELNKWREIPRS